VMDPGKPKLVGAPSVVPAQSTEQANASVSAVVSGLRLTTEVQVQERKVSYWALLALTAGALYVAYIIYRPFLKAMFLALVLTIAFWPVHRWISKRIQSGSVRALVTTLAAVLLIMLPLMLISVRLLSEAVSFYSFISQSIGSNWAGHYSWLTEAIERVGESTGIPPAQFKAIISSRVQEVGSWLVGTAGWAARGFATQLGSAILTLLIMFFFLRDSDRYTRALVHALPLPAGRVHQLTETLRVTVVSNVYGMVVVGLIQGSLVALAWWFTGLREPLLWGAIATIFSFVPMVGPSLIWWPGVFVLATQGRWISAVVLMAWGFLVVTGADYTIRPRFAGGQKNANTLLVLLSLLGGLKAFGPVGIIAGPVVLSVVTSLLTMVGEERESQDEIVKKQAA
jgi:predicted PurR-regulated permease PerM